MTIFLINAATVEYIRNVKTDDWCELDKNLLMPVSKDLKRGYENPLFCKYIASYNYFKSSSTNWSVSSTFFAVASVGFPLGLVLLNKLGTVYKFNPDSGVET